MKKQFLETGQIVGTHGIKGELRVQPWADSPDFLCDFDEFYLSDDGKNKINIIKSRVHKNIVIFKIPNVNTLEEAEKYRNKILYIDRNDIDIDDRYFISDLIGCQVFNIDTSEKIGEITDVSKTGANDVWHINRNNKICLIPAIPSCVINVDIDHKKVDIRPLDGIFDI